MLLAIDSVSFFPSPLALWVSRICSLRNLLKASSATLQAPLVGTGGGTQRSREMIGIQSSCQRFNLPKPAHQRIKSSRNVGELISNPVQLQVTWWVFTVLLSHNNSVASEAFLVIGNVHLALFTWDPYKICWKWKELFFTDDLVQKAKFSLKSCCHTITHLRLKLL